jgi:hypothetical protein
VSCERARGRSTPRLPLRTSVARHDADPPRGRPLDSAARRSSARRSSCGMGSTPSERAGRGAALDSARVTVPTMLRLLAKTAACPGTDRSCRLLLPRPAVLHCRPVSPDVLSTPVSTFVRRTG